MRRPLLILPVLLVILIAGYAQGEASEVEAGLEAAKSALHPVKEQAEIRGTREAGNKDKKLKTAERKEKRINKRLRNNAKKQGNGNTNTAKKGQIKKKNNEKRNKRKRKKKNGKKQKDKKKKKKKKHHRRKNKNKTKKPTRSKQAAGGDWSSCGTSGVNDTCLINAVNALNFEKNQIQNFFKQKARMENQAKVTGKKLGKKGEFKDAAKYMLMSIGGDINNVTCGEDNSTSSTRGAKKASETYTILINCSVSIKAACDTPNNTMNSTFNDGCAKIYNLSKTASEDCRTNTNYTTNGPLACNCWEKAAIGITIAKAEGCTAQGLKQAKAMKAQKKKCIDAFSKCKKAEDTAIGLIHTCMSGEVNTNSSSAEKAGRVF